MFTPSTLAPGRLGRRSNQPRPTMDKTGMCPISLMGPVTNPFPGVYATFYLSSPELQNSLFCFLFIYIQVSPNIDVCTPSCCYFSSRTVSGKRAPSTILSVMVLYHCVSHSSAMVLPRQHNAIASLTMLSCSVVVCSANLHPAEWESVGQVIWTQDFKLLKAHTHTHTHTHTHMHVRAPQSPLPSPSSTHYKVSIPST
jgi:hypothetical protein